MLARNQNRRGSFEISERSIFLAEGGSRFCAGGALRCSDTCRAGSPS